ncbi:hypothetical protein D3C76_902230 [compost metagenome]
MGQQRSVSLVGQPAPESFQQRPALAHHAIEREGQHQPGHAGQAQLQVLAGQGQQGFAGSGLDARALRQRAGFTLGQRLQLIQRLRSLQPQAHVGRAVEPLVKTMQRVLERLFLHHQTRSPPGDETARGMTVGQAQGQGSVDQGVGVRGTGNELGLQHLALGELRRHSQDRFRQHVDQPRQPLAKRIEWHFEEIIGRPRPGAGIEPPAPALYPGHQPLTVAITGTAEKHQVFEEMRQPRITLRLIVAARANPQQRRRTRRIRHVNESRAQPVGQDDAALLGGHGGFSGLV